MVTLDKCYPDFTKTAADTLAPGKHRGPDGCRAVSRHTGGHPFYRRRKRGRVNDRE